MEFKAKTVQECWTIIREETEIWQLRANNPEQSEFDRETCLLIRDALDSLSLRILHGEKREQ